MSERELPVWVAVSAMAGAACVLLLLWLRNTCRSRHDARARIVELHTQWLAARLTLSRASLSLVSAFRMLTAEPHDSPLVRLRSEEAQRTRREWFECMRELDRVEAALRAWSALRGVDDAIPPRVGADALRIALEGGGPEIERLRRDLREADDRALQRLKHCVESQRSGFLAWGVIVWFVRLQADLRRITDRWSRP